MKPDVVVVDAPGQSDTRGDDIEIATSAACSQIAENCRTPGVDFGWQSCEFCLPTCRKHLFAVGLGHVPDRPLSSPDLLKGVDF